MAGHASKAIWNVIQASSATVPQPASTVALVKNRSNRRAPRACALGPPEGIFVWESGRIAAVGSMENLFDRGSRGLHLRHHAGRQGQVAESHAELLAVGQAPVGQRLDRVALARLVIRGMHQPPGVGHDRVGIVAFRVGDERAQVGRQFHLRQRGRTRFRRGRDVLAALFSSVAMGSPALLA